MRYRLSDLKHFFFVAFVNAHISTEDEKEA